MMYTRKHPRQRVGLGLPNNGAGGRRHPQQPPLLGGLSRAQTRELKKKMD